MADEERWLAVGLTNPEGEYGGTRHNIGADVIRAAAARQGVELKHHKAGALVADTFAVARDGSRLPLTLAVPYGYMNESGGPVQQLVRFYSLDPSRLVVVQDELDLDVGTLRLKRGGTGGHNGVRDVKQRLGTDDFLRLRFGIGRPPGRMPAARYVLARFGAAERRDVVDVAVEEAVDALLQLVTEGLEPTQNRVHTS